MQVRNLLTPERTAIDVHGVSKKRVLDQVASMAATSCPQLDEQNIFDALIAREKLGSTGIGEGIAIPHCRLNTFDKPVGFLIRLDEAVDFDAIDSQPVDLFFVLLVPENQADEHLETLSHLASMFNNEELRKSLRGAHSGEEMYRRLIDTEISQSAAS